MRLKVHMEILGSHLVFLFPSPTYSVINSQEWLLLLNCHFEPVMLSMHLYCPNCCIICSISSTDLRFDLCVIGFTVCMATVDVAVAVDPLKNAY